MADQQHILVLNSYHQGQRWADGESAGIERVFREEAPTNELHFFYLDAQRMPEAAWRATFLEELRQITSRMKFEGVLVMDNDAFDLAREHCKELFPSVPVVFCGVNDFKESQIAGLTNFTGVAENPDYKATIETAVALFPKTRKVFCVCDDTLSGLAHENAIRRILPEIPFVEVQFYNAGIHTMAQTLDRVALLQSDAVVLMLRTSQATGQQVTSSYEMLTTLPLLSQRPVFVVSDSLFSPEAFGGKVLTGSDQGENAARMLLTILSGKKISDLPVCTNIPAHYLFSDSTLRRFGVSHSQLPKPNDIIGRRVSVFEEHPVLVLLTLLMVVVLASVASILGMKVAGSRRTQAALQESEAMFRMLFEHSAVGAAQVDPTTGHYLRVNERFCQILGYSRFELLRRSDSDLSHPESRAQDWRQQQRLISGEIKEYSLQKRYFHHNGSTIWTSFSAALLGKSSGAIGWLVFVIQDITHLKEAEDRQIQAERISAVGQLSGGIAHEFNNMLMIILGYTDLLRTQHARIPGVVECCEIIGAQVLRGRDIVSQMMTLANPQPMLKETFRASDLIKETLQSQSAAIESERVRVNVQLGVDATISGDRRSLLQAFSALILNARHAVRIKGSGDITIKTTFQNELLELSVVDTGVGISESVKRKIFTPFFTTKGGFSPNDMGLKGTGLALCVALRIVQMHNGSISFESDEGKGSRFTISLPAQPEDAKALSAPVVQLQSSAIPATRSTPRILVVDDEPSICDILQQVLLKLGYPLVETAFSGSEALKKIKNQSFDLAFVDLKMAEISGGEVVRTAIAQGVKTQFIMVSGQMDVTEEEVLRFGAKAFLYKPFSLEQLKIVLQRVQSSKT